MMNPGLVMEYFIVWSLPVVEEVPYFEGAPVVFSCKQSLCLHSALLTKTHTQVHSWSAPVAEWLLPGYCACHRTAESLVRFQSGGWCLSRVCLLRCPLSTRGKHGATVHCWGLTKTCWVHFFPHKHICKSDFFPPYNFHPCLLTFFCSAFAATLLRFLL